MGGNARLLSALPTPKDKIGVVREPPIIRLVVDFFLAPVFP